MKDVCGIVTNLGHLYCVPCAERLGYSPEDHVVIHKGEFPHAFEPCDSCSRLPHESRSIQEVKRRNPELAWPKPKKKKLETTTMPIVDGVIESPVYEGHKRGKNWTAVIEFDRKAPKGIKRTFLKGYQNNEFVSPSTLKPGDIIEFGADYISGSGRRSTNRRYAIVLAKTEKELVRTKSRKDVDELKADIEDLKQEEKHTASQKEALKKLLDKAGQVVTKLVQEKRAPSKKAVVASLPKRSPFSTGDAIALSSPGGKMSKRAAKAADERLRVALFGEKGLQPKSRKMTTEEEIASLHHRAKELRDLATRGMKPRAYKKEAERLEAMAADMSQSGHLDEKVYPVEDLQAYVDQALPYFAAEYRTSKSPRTVTIQSTRRIGEEARLLKMSKGDLLKWFKTAYPRIWGREGILHENYHAARAYLLGGFEGEKEEKPKKKTSPPKAEEPKTQIHSDQEALSPDADANLKDVAFWYLAKLIRRTAPGKKEHRRNLESEFDAFLAERARSLEMSEAAIFAWVEKWYPRLWGKSPTIYNKSMNAVAARVIGMYRSGPRTLGVELEPSIESEKVDLDPKEEDKIAAVVLEEVVHIANQGKDQVLEETVEKKVKQIEKKHKVKLDKAEKKSIEKKVRKAVQCEALLVEMRKPQADRIWKVERHGGNLVHSWGVDGAWERRQETPYSTPEQAAVVMAREILRKEKAGYKQAEIRKNPSCSLFGQVKNPSLRSIPGGQVKTAKIAQKEIRWRAI